MQKLSTALVIGGLAMMPEPSLDNELDCFPPTAPLELAAGRPLSLATLPPLPPPAAAAAAPAAPALPPSWGTPLNTTCLVPPTAGRRGPPLPKSSPNCICCALPPLGLCSGPQADTVAWCFCAYDPPV